MQDETPVPVQPKKRGCLKWLCGGCLGIVVLSALAVALSWHFLTRRETGISAWEHLPPSAAMAIEAHDVHSILEHAAKDKGLMSLVAGFADIFTERLDEMLDGESLSQSRAAYSAESLSELSFLFPFVVPASVVLGVSHEGGVFLIARPPVWFSWLVDSGAEGTIERVAGGERYYCFIGGWLVAATERSLALEIVDNWHRRAKPLGQAMGKDTAFIVAAGRTASGLTPEVKVNHSDPAPQQQLLVLADPFAANKAASVAEDVAWKVIATPGDGAWVVNGTAGMVESVAGTEAFFNEYPKSEPALRSLLTPPHETYDVFVKAFVSPDFLRKRLALPASQTPPSQPNDPRARMGRLVQDTWFNGNATGECLLFAKKPSLPPDPDLPPAPVLALGWRLGDATDRKAVADRFAASVHGIVDSMRRDDSGLAKALGEHLKFVDLERNDGVGEMLDIPPVILNSAKPAWFFPRDGAHGVGWIATDPSAMDDLPSFDDADSQDRGEILAGSASWDLSEDFRLSVLELLSDRLETLPDSIVGDREKILTILSAVNDILSAYPRGSLDCQGNESAGKISFTATIPFGVQVWFDKE